MAADVCIRRITVHDLDAVWRFIGRNAVTEWGRDDLGRFLQDSLNSGLIAVKSGRLLGVLLYGVRLEEVTLALTAVVVAAGSRRRGVGSRMLWELGRHLEAVGRGRIEAVVSERDLSSQLFLRANGFRAVRVLRGLFGGGADDGYLLEKLHAPAAGATSSRGRAHRGDRS